MLDSVCLNESVTFCLFLLLQSPKQYVWIYNPISLLKILFLLLLDTTESPPSFSLRAITDPVASCLLLQLTLQKLQNYLLLEIA